jgi:hypothetical protein
LTSSGLNQKGQFRTSKRLEIVFFTSGIPVKMTALDRSQKTGGGSEEDHAPDSF